MVHTFKPAQLHKLKIPGEILVEKQMIYAEKISNYRYFLCEPSILNPTDAVFDDEEFCTEGTTKTGYQIYKVAKKFDIIGFQSKVLSRKRPKALERKKPTNCGL